MLRNNREIIVKLLERQNKIFKDFADKYENVFTMT